MKRYLESLGPGLLMAATAIGASHLVLSVQAGARHGYLLLWVVLGANLLKYPAFEYGPRFAMATGTSLLAGYARVPGPGRWALWLFLLGTIVQGVGVVAGVVGLAAAVTAAVWPALGVPAWSAVLLGSIVVLLASGRYDGLESAIKVLMVVLLVATVVAFLVTPVPLGAAANLVVPTVPAGALALIVALVGWMPAGIDVSVWHSLWSLEKRRRWMVEPVNGSEVGAGEGGIAGGEVDGDRADVDPATSRGHLERALLDMRVGYGFTTLTALVFLALGGALLHPRGLVLESVEVAPTLARIYTESLGEWIRPIFLLAAFSTFYSTVATCLDGFPRAWAETWRRLGSGSGGWRGYWPFLLSIAAAALAVVAWWPDPVLLVTTVAVISFLFAPVYAALNYYCAVRLVDEVELRPGTPSRIVCLLAVAVMGATALLYLRTLI